MKFALPNDLSRLAITAIRRLLPRAQKVVYLNYVNKNSKMYKG